MKVENRFKVDNIRNIKAEKDEVEEREKTYEINIPSRKKKRKKKIMYKRQQIKEKKNRELSDLRRTSSEFHFNFVGNY